MYADELRIVKDQVALQIRLNCEPVPARILPCFHYSIKSSFGMLPLPIATSAGSELERGLGAIILGAIIVVGLI